jgi:hypothetical protein
VQARETTAANTVASAPSLDRVRYLRKSGVVP